MGTMLRSGGETWEGNEDLDLPAATRRAIASLNKKVVARYPDASARDTGEADAAPGGQGPAGDGSVFYLGSNGYLYCKSGGTNREIPLLGVNYVEGIADITTNTAGLFGIAHPLDSINVSCQLTHEKAGPDPDATAIEARIRWSIIQRDPGQVNFRVWNTETRQIYANTGLRFHYRIKKLS